MRKRKLTIVLLGMILTLVMILAGCGIKTNTTISKPSGDISLITDASGLADAESSAADQSTGIDDSATQYLQDNSDISDSIGAYAGDLSDDSGYGQGSLFDESEYIQGSLSDESGYGQGSLLDDSKSTPGAAVDERSGLAGGKKIDKYGSYTKKEDVALYIYTYGRLPDNFITKKEAKKLGWSGGSLEPYASGKCIGGDYFGNYEGRLPEKKGREYHECDIDTLGRSKRGAKRIIYSNDGLIYYTGDHYSHFELLYGEE